jgi:hypothetical protein
MKQEEIKSNYYSYDTCDRCGRKLDEADQEEAVKFEGEVWCLGCFEHSRDHLPDYTSNN